MTVAALSDTFDLSAFSTLTDLMRNSIARYANAEALRQFNKETKAWESHTYEAVGEKIAAWQKSFCALGLERGSRVAILMPNSVDHVYADQAVLANGLVPVPLHAIDTPGSSAFIIIDSQAQVLVTSSLKRWQQIEATGVPCPDLHTVVIADPNEVMPEPMEGDAVKLFNLTDWLAFGETYTDPLPAAPSKDDLAGIIYTSGTTGRPKGVMLTHHNIVSNVKATLACVSPRQGDTFLSFLPLSHTFERTAGYYLALATGCRIAYNRSVLLLADDLKTIRPDVIISVPRVYERIYARVQHQLKKASSTKRALFNWAVNIGWRDFCRKNHMPIEGKVQSLLDPILRPVLLKKVSKTLTDQFGGNLRIAISGGASLNSRIAQVFCGLGLPIIQGYGMTEASPIIAGNNLEINQPNTVGLPFNGVQIRLGEGDEIQVKADSIMKGYWNRPDDTKAAFTEDGWLKTGDVGGFNERGLLSIKGRIKEIIVTSTGEKVPPADVESAIETDQLFAQSFVIGENRPFIGAIVVVNPEEWANFASSLGLDPEDPASLNAPEARSAALRRAKAALKNFPNYALPRAVVLTREPWTIENGLLTPTLKLKRKVMQKQFASEMAKLYSTHG